MPRYRASWRESTKLLPGTLPNAWLYRSADFECASREEAQSTARQLLPPTGELLEVLDVDNAITTASPSPLTDARPQPTFTGRRRIVRPSGEERPVAEDRHVSAGEPAIVEDAASRR